MDERRSYGLLVVAIVALGIALRVVPLYWSALPATLDGFRYARLAHLTVTTGHLPIDTIDPDEIGFTLVIAGGSVLTGIQPLFLAQPLTAVIGATTPLAAVVLVRLVGTDLEWAPRRTYYAAVIAGLGLTLDGLFLRRTGVPDEELLGLLLVPILAVLFQRTLRTHRLRWLSATTLVFTVLPVIHSLSTLIGVLTITALLAVRLPRASAHEALLGSGLAAAVWVWLFGYFAVAAQFGIQITHSEQSELLTSHLGLFIAWVVLLVLATVSVRSLSPRVRTAAAALPLGLWFVVLIANVVQPVYPGTIQTPPLVLALLMTFIPTAILTVAGLLTVEGRSQDLLLALLGAPIMMTLYALTASLSPLYFNTILRVQTFAHVPAIVLATAAVVEVNALGLPSVDSVRVRRTVRVVGVVVLLASLTASVPLAYLNLDTATYPSTTLESEFEAATFTAQHVEGPIATDQTLSSVIVNYYETDAEPTMGPTTVWLRGGPPPACPMLGQASWTTSGTHLFPTAPKTVSAAHYETTLAKRNVVYRAAGQDPITMTVPQTTTAEGCR